MTIQNIEGIIWLALKSNIDLWTETVVMQPGQILQPTADQAFMVIQDVGLEYSGIKPIDDDCGEPIDGTLFVGVMAPVEWTWAQHKGLASRFCDHMINGAPFKYSGNYVTLRERPRILGASRLDGAWNRVDAQIKYRSWG